MATTRIYVRPHEDLLSKLREIFDIPDPLPGKCRSIQISIPCDGAASITYECHALRPEPAPSTEVTSG